MLKKGLKFCCCCIVIVVYEKQCRCYFLLKSIMEDQISEILSLNFTAMELSSNVLCPFLVWGLRSGDETVIGNGHLHLLESSETSIAACFSFCRLEIMKLKSVSYIFYVHRHGLHEQMMCLIFVLLLANFRFLTKCHFERIWFLQALERFAFLQQIWSSADNNEVYINRLHYRLDSSSLDCQDFSANSPSPPLRKHRIRQFCFGRLYSITVTCRCPVDWKFVVYNLCSY